jgi:hypothetical protein
MRVGRRALLTIAVLAASGSAAAVEIDGWDKTQWGMTPEEVVAALPGTGIHRISEPRVLAPRPGEALLRIDGLDVAGHKLAVRFLFTWGTHRLNIVNLTLEGEANPLVVEGAFRDLKRVLVSRYGPAIYRHEDRNEATASNEALFWRLGRTSVELSRVQAEGSSEILMLHYEPTEPLDELR